MISLSPSLGLTLKDLTPGIAIDSRLPARSKKKYRRYVPSRGDRASIHSVFCRSQIALMASKLLKVMMHSVTFSVSASMILFSSSGKESNLPSVIMIAYFWFVHSSEVRLNFSGIGFSIISD
ncbi:hypothetical protein D3C76_928160 [compost metagenome]